MKVKDLIEQLGAFNPSADVSLTDSRQSTSVTSAKMEQHRRQQGKCSLKVVTVVRSANSMMMSFALCMTRTAKM